MADGGGDARERSLEDKTSFLTQPHGAAPYPVIRCLHSRANLIPPYFSATDVAFLKAAAPRERHKRGSYFFIQSCGPGLWFARCRIETKQLPHTVKDKGKNIHLLFCFSVMVEIVPEDDLQKTLKKCYF